MKKVSLLISALCIMLMVSCCNNCGDKKDGKCCAKKECKIEKCCAAKADSCQLTAEQKELNEKWAKFDSLSVEEQRAIIAVKKAKIDTLKADLRAKADKLESDFADFESLEPAKQKELLDAQKCCKKKCCKKACKKECSKATENVETTTAN